jgi:hypothetical protein
MIVTKMKNFIQSKWVLFTVVTAIALLLFFTFSKEKKQVVTSSVSRIDTKIVNQEKEVNSLPEKDFLKKEDVVNSSTDYYMVSTNKRNAAVKFDLSENVRVINGMINGNEDGSLDLYLNNFLKSKEISRKSKIDTIWNVLKSSELTPEQNIYFLDYIETLMPIELTGDMISFFDTNLEADVKKRILDVLKSSLFIANPEKQTEEQLGYIAEQSEIIENFFETQILNHVDNNLVKHAMLLYPSVASSEQAEKFVTQLLNNQSNYKYSLTDFDVANLAIQVAFSNEEMQNSFLPELLDKFNEFPPEDREKFNEIMYSALRSNNTANKELIDHNSFEKLKEYIKQQEPFVPEDYRMISHEPISTYYNWIDTYSSVAANSTDSIAKAV